MQTIKITHTDKGEFHWENFLLKKQEQRLNKLLVQLEVDPWTKRKVFILYKQQVKRDNIIRLFPHDIRLFLQAIITRDIDPLLKSTSQIS